MDKIYPDLSGQIEFTEGTNKRRISSILKAPRTPLRDLGSANELTQTCAFEKSQKNSKRVSFAEIIRVSPSGSQTVVALNHAEEAKEEKIQKQCNQVEKPEDVLCKIAGMTTLLHAPIQTPLQQIECHSVNTIQDSSKMDKTVIFSEENEMDMTSGHTIMINYAAETCQETENTKKIDFRSFSAELKSKQVPQVNEFSFSGCPAEINETTLSLQKRNTENTKKINFGDFLKTLKSTKVFHPPVTSNVSSDAPERNTSTLEKNVCSQLQENGCNVTTNFGRPSNWQNYVTSLPPNQKAIASPTWHISKQLGCAEVSLACRKENIDVIPASTEIILSSGNGLLNIDQSQVENLGNTKKYMFKTSAYQHGIQQEPSMYVNERNVNNNVNSAHAVGITNNHVLQDGYLMPTNCTGLIWNEKCRSTDHTDDGTYENQRNHISSLIKESVSKEDQTRSTKNRASMNSYLNSQGTGPIQKAAWDNREQLNGTINHGLWNSYLPETKENALLASLPSEKLAAFSSTSSHLNSFWQPSFYEEQKENQFSFMPDNKQGAYTTAIDNQTGRKHGVSVNATSLIPVDKRAAFTFSEDMEITNLASCLIGNSQNPVNVQNTSDLEVGTAKKNANYSNSNKTVIFSLTGDNDMEITKNYNIVRQHEKNPWGLCLQSQDNIYTCHNDVDESKTIMNVAHQHVENSTQAMQNLNNVTSRRTHIGSPKDKTVMFNLTEENEMEITKSHTVVLGHDSIPQNEDIPIRSVMSSDKTIMCAYGEDMEITKPITRTLDKSLRTVTGNVVPEQGIRTDKKNVPVFSSEKSVLFPHSENNEMELTRSLTVKVEGSFQPGPHIFGEKTNTSVCSDNMAITKSTTFLGENNDMEITKPETHMKDAWQGGSHFKVLLLEDQNRKGILPMADGEKTICFQHEDNEMEFTRSHTVNNHLIQQTKVATQGLSSSLANEANIFTQSSSGGETNSSSFLSAEQTRIFMCKNEMEMTRPLWGTLQKNTCFQALPQIEKETSTAKLPGSFQDHTAVLALQNNEMEITRCHTVALNHDTVSQPERTQVCQDNMNIIESESVTKHTMDSWQKEVMKLSKYPGKELSPKHMVNDTESNRRHTMLCHNRTNLTIELDSQDKLHFPSSKFGACTEGANLLHNTVYDGKLKKCDEQIGNQNFEQDLDNVPVCHSKMHDREMTKNARAVSCESYKDVPDGKKHILNSPIKSRERTMTFFSDENMEMKNSHSQANSASEFPTSVIGYEKKLDSVKFDKGISEKAFCLDVLVPRPVSQELKEVPDPVYKETVNLETRKMCVQEVPLKKFPPKLPNKRKSVVADAENTSLRSEGRTETEGSEISLFLKKDKTTPNLNPSCCIDEEQLPVCLEEMDSTESLHCEGPDKLMDLYNEREIVDKQAHRSEVFETRSTQKRAWCQEDEELQSEKKLKVDEEPDNTKSLNQPLSPNVIIQVDEETHENKSVPDLITTNLEKTQSSNSSSLDTVKTDADFSIQQDDKLETQLLIDSICEQNLQEKLQGGSITVREFFTLLQLHVVIQKPRQSLLPRRYEVNTAPTTEDKILSQYVYHPKLQVYDEDCQVLCKITEELKLKADDQDKLLVNVNKSLWEVMRTCPDEELKGFGAELNKIKTYFTKRSKVLAHRGKNKLYTKLVQGAQHQWKELLSKLAKMDELLKEIDICLDALETETKKLEESELDVNDAVSEYESKLRETERELDNYRAQEEAQEREQSNIRNQKQQLISEISRLQEDANICQKLMEKYSFSEWVIKEWNDRQAVFTFLYDSIELTLGLGRPRDNVSKNSKFGLKIDSMEFESLLDETKASPSSKLVHRLIFQFINSQKSWHEKCSTVHHLCQVLHDLSLVVSRCKLLGEEIDFLDRWGGKSNLMKIEVNDTKVMLLFSSSIPFAKFKIELSLTASYPASPVAFRIEKCTGNLSQEEIFVVLLNIPMGASYLKRMVAQINQTLLQCRSGVCKE